MGWDFIEGQDPLTQMIEGLSSADPEQRAEAAINLAFVGMHPEKVALTLMRVLVADPDPQVRASCAEALGYLRATGARTALVRASRDADETLREAARVALERIEAEGEERRLSERCSTQISAQFYMPRSTAIHRGTVLNLSHHGFFLGETVGLEPGMKIDLVLHDQRVPPLGCTARVVRESDRQESGGYGCALLPLSDSKSRWLDRLLQLHAN